MRTDANTRVRFRGGCHRCSLIGESYLGFVHLPVSLDNSGCLFFPVIFSACNCADWWSLQRRISKLAQQRHRAVREQITNDWGKSAPELILPVGQEEVQEETLSSEPSSCSNSSQRWLLEWNIPAPFHPSAGQGNGKVSICTYSCFSVHC